MLFYIDRISPVTGYRTTLSILRSIVLLSRSDGTGSCLSVRVLK